MGTAIKHPVPHQVKPQFVIFDIRALWRSASCIRRSKVSTFHYQVINKSTKFQIVRSVDNKTDAKLYSWPWTIRRTRRKTRLVVVSWGMMSPPPTIGHCVSSRLSRSMESYAASLRDFMSVLRANMRFRIDGNRQLQSYWSTPTSWFTSSSTQSKPGFSFMNRSLYVFIAWLFWGIRVVVGCLVVGISHQSNICWKIVSEMSCVRYNSNSTFTYTVCRWRIYRSR